MPTRAALIASVLRREQPVRPLLAYELRGSVVQLLGPGTTDPTWTSTPELLAAAIDGALARAEEKDTPAGAGAAFTPHALVLAPAGPDYRAACQCGKAIGRAPKGRSANGLVGLWEQHALDQADAATAWADALTALPHSS